MGDRLGEEDRGLSVKVGFDGESEAGMECVAVGIVLDRIMSGIAEATWSAAWSWSQACAR